MKKNRQSRSLAASLGTCLVAGMLFGGCSYRQIEDDLKQGLSAASQESGMTEAEGQVPLYDLSGENEYVIGDVVTQTIGEDTVTYTVTGIRTGNNLEAFGVTREECMQTAQQLFISENGGPLGGLDTRKNETYIFLEAGIRIRNINSAGQGMPGEPTELFLDVDLRTRSELETDDVHNQGMVYYSEHADDEKRYLYFPLEPGDEITVNVLWSVRESDLDEPLYCVTGMSTSRDNRQIILLNPEKE